MPHGDTEKHFWPFWLGGLAMLAVMMVIDPMIAKGNPALGIVAHQVAGTGAKVDEIQNAWLSNGVLPLARLLLLIDLLFISVYSWGAWNGARLMRNERKPALRALDLLVMVATIAFCLTDFAETLSQSVQLAQMKGRDTLARIAASVQPVKVPAFIATVLGLVAALTLRRWAR